MAGSKSGKTVEIGYVDQRHADIDPEKTVWQVISGGNEQLEIGGKLFNSRAYVSRFNFNGGDQQKEVRRIVRWRAQPFAFGDDPQNRGQRIAIG